MSRVPVTVTVISASGWRNQKSRKVYCVFELQGGPPRRTADVATSNNSADFDQDLNFYVTDYSKTNGKVQIMDCTRETDGQDTELGSGSFNVMTKESVASWKNNKCHYVKVPLSPSGYVELEVDVEAEFTKDLPVPVSVVRPPPPPPPPVPVGPDPELLRLQAEMSRIQADFARFQADNARLQSENQNLRDELARFREENERLRRNAGASAQAEAELARMREENQRLRNEVGRFDELLAQRERQVTERLRAEFEAAFERLRRELEAKAAMAAPDPRIELELAEQIRENELLRRQIQELTAQVDSQYDTIAKLRRELEAARAPPPAPVPVLTCTCPPVTCTCSPATTYYSSAPVLASSVHRPATVIPSYYRSVEPVSTPLVEWVRPDGLVGCTGCSSVTRTTLPPAGVSSAAAPLISISEPNVITVGGGAPAYSARPLLTAARPRTIWRP